MLALAMVLAQESVTVASISQGRMLVQRGLTLNTLSTGTEFVPLIGILLFGYLGDRFSKSHLLALAATLQIVTPALVMIPSHVAPVLLYPLVFGLGSGTVPLLLAIRADYFGRRAFATITAITMLITWLLGLPTFLLRMLVGGLLAATGSLVPGLVLSILIGLPAPVLFFFARRPRSRQPVASE